MVASPIVPGPFETIPPGGMRFFAYGDGGDDVTRALEGVVFAVIEDPEGWWKALRDDAPDHWGALPPGYQVQSTPERVQSAPAQLVSTAADGVALAPVEPGRHYLFCAMSPTVAGLVAGCTPQMHYPKYAAGLHVYFSGGRAYFIEHDRTDDSLHYEQYQRRGNWSQDPVSAAFVARVFLDFSDDDVPHGWYFVKGGVFAVVADADIDDWWRAVSRDGTFVISTEPETARYTISEWGSSNQFAPLLEVPGDTFESAPATYVSIGDGGVGTTMLAPGDYLFCILGLYGHPGTVGRCQYEDIADSHDVVIEYGMGEEGASFAEHSKSKGLRTLNELEQHFSDPAE